MPELKRNFSQAKMNKDMDERLVPVGQYRDALNIQIATSDGSNVGSAQTLLGNTIQNSMATIYDGLGSSSTNAYYNVPTTSVCVGSIALPDKDKIYYFIAAGYNISTSTTNSNGKPAANDIQKDYILEYDTITKTHKYVFVDIYRVKEQAVASTTVLDSFLYIPDLGSSTINKTGVRIGMLVTGTFNSTVHNLNDGVTVSDIAYDTGNSRWKISLEKDGDAYKPTTGVALNDEIVFITARVLNFNWQKQITGINVIDDLLFWTDISTEPKKINIKRSKAGTGGVAYLYGAGIAGAASATTTATFNIHDGDTDYFHTRLVVDINNDGNLQTVTNGGHNKATYVQEKHVTVVRKGPTQPLELKMSRTKNPRINASGDENASKTTIDPGISASGIGSAGDYSFFNQSPTPTEIFESGDEVDLIFDTAIDFRVGDILLFTNDDNPSETFDNYQVRGVVTDSNVTSPNALFTSGFKIEILSIDSSLTDTDQRWSVRLEDAEPLFEFKFVRFSYRYKYEDGEYSTFAPWSPIAFLPDTYEYFPKKGFNLGMRNQLRALTLQKYFPKPGILPEDVVEIDLLYKETNNPTVYTIKTINAADGHPVWPDNNKSGTTSYRGEYSIATDMIHAVVPSNQLLRPWDNVPRMALGQEISANRLIYGNYLQNYTVKDPIIELKLKRTIKDNVDDYAVPSVKTMRTYQAGVVFSDRYGRETPVLTNKNASIYVPKEASTTRNRLIAHLGNDTKIPSWAEYYAWYIKETSSEYYTLAMDRWYHAADGNIWLSFSSSERNKLDEETFLILKKAHGDATPVFNKAARYKILAIENEAPDFIKTEKKTLGTLYNTGADKFTDDGYPLLDHVYVTIIQSAFEDVFGDDLLIKTPDTMFIRFYGDGQISNFYEVTKISFINNNAYKLKIKGKFEDDISFTTSGAQAGTFGGAITDLSMDLIEHEVENRPEFDGRFFVKIYKDEVLSKHVLDKGNQAAELYVANQANLKYINNKYDGDQEGKIHDWTSKQWGGTSATANTSSTPSDGRYHPFALGNTTTPYSHHAIIDWGGSNNYVGGSSGVSDVDVENDPVDALNGRKSNAEVFWQGIANQNAFFIDACSAYSLTSGGPQYNGGGSLQGPDRPGASYDDAGTVKVYNNFDNMDGNAATNTNGAPGGIPGNTKKEAGQVSRGIWEDDGECLMDISWSGMGVGYGGTGSSTWGNKPFPHKVGDVGAPGGDQKYNNAANFIEELVQPGTKFRFQKDPDRETQIYTVKKYKGYFTGPGNHGLHNPAFYQDRISINSGVWGIRNVATDTSTAHDKAQYRGFNMRQRWTIAVEPFIGSGPSGYRPDKGTKKSWEDADPDNDGVSPLSHDSRQHDVIQIMRSFNEIDPFSNTFTDEPAIWETEPKETVDLDIYYQASGLIPLELNELTNEEYLPLDTTFNTTDVSGAKTEHTIDYWASPDTIHFTPSIPTTTSISDGQDIYFNKNYYSLSGLHKTAGGADTEFTGAVGTSTPTGGTAILTDDNTLKLYGGPGSATAGSTPPSYSMFRRYQVLDWGNCWVFGNGVESDRIRDDFNAPQMDNGVKASTVLAEPIKEERREHGLVWSGIYNSTSGINDTNQFIMAEKITKDLNPIYGSIQKLYNRDTRLIMLCEDKILRAVTNKDALYNADGKPQVVASNAVVGDVTPYQGDYGISTNPESFTATPYYIYFADQIRGQVLSLSTEGIISISDKGMKDYFGDNLKTYVSSVLGTYDENKKEYNITIGKKYHPHQILQTYTTLSYSENVKGWTSFKSFHPQNGLSLNNNYYTFGNSNSSVGGQLHIHHDNSTYNNFYGTQYKSNVTLVFNDNPAAVKSFNTINYEGSQAKVTAFTTASPTDAAGNTLTDINDNEYFNLTTKTGWYVDSIITNKQTGSVVEFKEKEGKWFGVSSGDATISSGSTMNVDEAEFSVQGLGTATFTHSSPSTQPVPSQASVAISIANRTGVSNWDTTAD